MLTLIRAFSFAYGGLRAAVMMHDRLIVKIVRAPVSFFDETPGGRILNRLAYLVQSSNFIVLANPIFNSYNYFEDSLRTSIQSTILFRLY